MIDLGDSEEEDCYDGTHSQSVLLGVKEEVSEEDEMTGEMMEQAKITTEQADTQVRPKAPGSPSTESTKYISNISLHDHGLHNYPYPEMPETTCLTMKEEKMRLHNLNNRLAGYIAKMR